MRIFWLFGLFFLFKISISHAHELGVKPYIAVNGSYLKHYSILGASTPDFILPHYLVQKKILVGDHIVFLLETEKLPLPTPTVVGSTITWDFGDGTKKIGAEATHRYVRAGSYIVTVTVAQHSDQPAFAERIMVHVLPDTSYVLPDVIIVVNGDTYGTSSARLKLSDGVFFAAKAKTGSADIVSYYWDLGDRTTSNHESLTHTYASYHAAAKPVLRVRDENGFIADTSVTLENSDLINSDKKPEAKRQRSMLLFLVLFLTVLIVGAIVKKNYKNPRR